MLFEIVKGYFSSYGFGADLTGIQPVGVRYSFGPSRVSGGIGSCLSPQFVLYIERYEKAA